MALYLNKWRWWILLAIMVSAFVGPGVYLVRGDNEPTVAGTAEVHASSATQLTVLSPFTGDEDRDGSVKVEYSTDATWGNGNDVTACESSTGGTPRVCWVPKLTASTTYYLRVTYSDPDGVSGTVVQTLSATTGATGADTWPPTLSIIKPMDGGTIAGNSDYPVSIDFTVFDKTGISTVAGDVQAIIDGTAYNAAVNPKRSGYYSYSWTTPTVGWHSVTAKAKDTAGNIGYAPTASFYVNSIAVNSAGVFTGDGTLLVRDNDNQICQDCHKGIKPHSSASTGAKYGNWSLTCRQCHTPHNTKNIFLIKEEIKTPNSGTKSVDFRAAISRGDTTSDPGQNTSYSFTNRANPGNGPCEVCHTRTANRNDGTPRYRNTGTGPDVTTAGGSHANPPFTAYPCIKCHSHKGGFAHGAGTGGGQVTDCLPCHGHDAGYTFTYSSVNYTSEGRGNYRTHSTHTENDADDLRGPNVFCDTCHNINNMPFFKTGTDTNGDGQFDLSETDVCASCHSSGGAFNGVNTTGNSVGAKDNFKAVNGDYANGGVYNADGTLKTGNEKWCVGCHDDAPSTINSKTAPIISGNNSTYGFFVNGHGKESGNYTKLSWQDTTATGNPAANRICHECHNTAYAHIGNSDAGTPRNKRLQWWDATEQSNKTCKQCHDNANPDAIATADPQWYTTYSAWQSSAHGSTAKGNLQCARCHEPHGMGGASKPAMTRDLTETLCFNCHTSDAGAWMNVQNDAVSGSTLATSIEQAFGFGVKHPLGQSFTLTDYGNKTFTLNCISCHNVHLVTGKYWEADQNLSPITKLTDNLNVWGDEASEKMTAYVGSGTYRTPNEPAGAQFTGDQLPDYPSFCLSCHGDSPTDVRTGASTTYSGNTHFGISWTSDPHGKESANMGNGTGTCPDWYGCGKAEGWDNDLCTGTQSQCWPVKIRGRGEQTWTRSPYNEEERIAGANFTLACINCHEAHGSGNGSMLRTNPNGGTGSTIWNTMCNNCHWYYSDWHAGMSCGSASCHEVNSIHRMKKNDVGGGTRTWEPSQVVYYAFENDLNDSGTWRMHGKWYNNSAGSFTTGKNGQAAVFDGTKNVQVGTRNDYWSTDAGNHGTWVYTEMKYNTTQEAWVYLTDSSKSEYSIFTKHTGYSNGGYAFVLRNINGIFRPVFLMQADNNSFTLGGNAGVRGAYGATGVPLNTWAHVAVTFDTAGPDRNGGDPTVGRIRLYINGVDVTTSNSSGDIMQPGANETSIFAYSENSNYNESVCDFGSWCASEFSIGGFYGWQSAFIGRIDEASVWNITKPASYFTPIDQSTAPVLLAASWDSSIEKVLVTFTEGVYTNTGMSGALTPADFTLASAGGRTITAVTHTAGSYSVQLTLSSPLDASTINVATVAAASTTAIYDKYNNAAGTTARTITGEICPSYPVTFNLNEAGTSTIKETQNIISGTAYYDNDNNDTTALVASTTAVAGGVYTGNGPTVSAGSGSNYAILFDNNGTCLGATTGVSLEARIKPTGIPANTTTNYVGRIFGKWNDTDNTISHQLSVWRQPAGAGFANYSPAANTASIALWIKVSDMHATTNYRYKPVLTEATNTGSAEYCRIENDHWYYVKATFNTNKPGGTPGQQFVPGDIYVEDQGTDGAGAGRNWVGLKNCTDADQSQFSTPTAADNRKLYTADVNVAGTGGRFTIGADPACKTGASGCTQVTHFNGSIDYVVINEMPPSAPTIGTATSLSPYSIRWNFTDTADTEDGFSVHDSSHVVKATSATQNLTYLDEGSLSPNTQYTRHVHSYNTGGDSNASADTSRYTLSVTPSVTADKATSTWYGTPDVVFTNAVGFGAGGVQYYRYVWNQSATYTFNDTETQWSTGTLTKTATVAGMWYLHVKSYNGNNVANGTQAYGPYYYNTPPTVVTTLPENGAILVAVNGNVNIAWSQDVNCATVTTGNVTISGGGWALLSCSGNEAAFTTSGQSNATTYTVTVTTAVTDATGKPMAANYPFSYTTSP